MYEISVLIILILYPVDHFSRPSYFLTFYFNVIIDLQKAVINSTQNPRNLSPPPPKCDISYDCRTILKPGHCHEFNSVNQTTDLIQFSPVFTCIHLYFCICMCVCVCIVQHCLIPFIDSCNHYYNQDTALYLGSPQRILLYTPLLLNIPFFPSSLSLGNHKSVSMSTVLSFQKCHITTIIEQICNHSRLAFTSKHYILEIHPSCMYQWL